LALSQEGPVEFLHGQVQVVHEPGRGRREGGRQGDRQAREPLQQAAARAGGLVPPARLLRRAGHHVPAPAAGPRPRRAGGGRRGGRGRLGRRRVRQGPEGAAPAVVPVPEAQRARPAGEEPQRRLV
jgi:hypothetical protein